uniref:Uncharacterized protein n=1 Tax=Avena sativa TaxID=4498 RepID=A0ACD5WKA5_AVESA
MASKQGVSSPMQAEAEALLLAAAVAQNLNIQNPVFFSDCRNLTLAAAAPDERDQLVPWEIRKQINQFHRLIKHLGSQIFHISREINGVAHCCAHQARRSIGSLPTNSCRTLAHSKINCPIISSIRKMQDDGLVIMDVQCF